MDFLPEYYLVYTTPEKLFPPLLRRWFGFLKAKATIITSISREMINILSP